MVEDLRVCPYCRKAAPAGKVWAGFDAHKRGCLKRLEAKPKSTEEIFLDRIGSISDLFKGLK